MYQIYNRTFNENDRSYLFIGISKGISSGQATSYYPFVIPPNTNMVYMLCVGGGSGGGGGGVSAASTAGGGGQGGGSGGIARLIIPRIFLPDIIYLFPGEGGVGGIGNNSPGTAGTLSNIQTFSQTGDTQGQILQSGAAASSGGAAGNGTAPGTGAGLGETIATVALCLASNPGITQFVAGQTGGASTASGGNSGSTQTSPYLVTGGGGAVR